MSFITYSLDYYYNELEKLESTDATEATIYHAKQLLKMLDDLEDEGYFELNEKLEETFHAVSRLRSYISNHHADPFELIHKPLEESGLTYEEREVELTEAVETVAKKAKDNGNAVNIPEQDSNKFIEELKRFCDWIGYKEDTAYIFLLRDTLIPYIYYKEKGRERIYPWLLGRKTLNRMTGKEGVDDEIRANVIKALESGQAHNFSEFCEHVLPNIRESIQYYPEIENCFKKMLEEITERRILVIESGCSGTFPLLLMSLDERVDMRMYTTYPYLLETYGDRIYTPKYEENRLFETLYSQDLYFRFSDLRDGKFYVNKCESDVVEKKALEEVRELFCLEFPKESEFEQLRTCLYKLYDIEIEQVEAAENGAGGLTYFVSAGNKKYVVKYPNDNAMNHSEVEIRVCEVLLEKGIPACRFLQNKQGEKISTDESGRKFTLQDFYEGITYDYNSAPVCAQKESAILLAKIHNAMKDIENIPVGIDENFFVYRKPEYMKEPYTATLRQAIANGDNEIVDAIRSNMRIIEAMPAYGFDSKRFSVGNTHGDYMISQLLWKEEKISAVIDWTCACRHPYIWEIVRSYIFMAPEVGQGEIDIKAFIQYIANYTEIASLNAYDIENAGKLFYYFLAVCNFYEQYYKSLSENRFIFLKQAKMASGLLVWFEKHIDELNEKLCEFAKLVTYQKKMASYYDFEGRLSQYPSKKPMRVLALTKIAECFESERNYTEKEVNEIIRENISFSDIELIRREMFQYKLLGRLRDGSQYWREA